MEGITPAGVIGLASSYLVSAVNNAITHSHHPIFAWINRGDDKKRRLLAIFLSAATAAGITLLTTNKLEEEDVKQVLSSGLALFIEVISGQAFFHHWFLKEE